MFDDNATRSAAQVDELCEMRDSINRTFLDKPEIMSIIEAIVEVFKYHFFIKL